MTGRDNPRLAAKPVVYCLVPSELALKLHESLLRHFRDDPAVGVIVDRRAGERRRVEDRRAGMPRCPDDAQLSAPPAQPDRRTIRSLLGRRVGDRRATAIEVSPLALPRKARPFAAQIVFLERLEPSGEQTEDMDTARVVTAFQEGDRDAFAVLYIRYFDRVYGYLRVALNDPVEAEDAAQQVFVKILEALPRYERRDQPFRAWLFTIVRNHLRSEFLRRTRTRPVEPSGADPNGSMHDDEELTAELRALSWISDSELQLFIERLPLAQRQVLFLRYALDLTHAQTAAVLGRNTLDVRQLHSRSLRFLRARLTAVGRPSSRARPRMVRRRCKAHVLRSRRFALSP